MQALLRDLVMPHLGVRLDGPALMFLLPVLLVSLAAALASPRYLEQPRYRHEGRARFWLMGALFVLGMVGALLAADLVAFLVCWEVMTLASYALVAYETREAECLRAAFKYFVMTHVGAAALLFAIVLLRVAGGSFAFDALPGTLATLAATRPGLLHTVLALVFVGFATKAGLWPFGDWLPDAHPAAPAPVSAVLSGVMVKLGLYGLLRFFVHALALASPADAMAWGWVMVAFGLVSALAGGFAACAAMDAKVLLAYSTVAQSGIVTLGFGAALVLAPAHPVLAAVALLGAAFHVVGDAVVKALLFLGAGALQWRTGSRRLEELGGLFAGMPFTGSAALIGALAIAGFPPLPAFVAKWMLLQATVLSHEPALTLAGLGLLVASVASVLYAVKLFAAAFANRPMRPGKLEVPLSMRIAQGVLLVPVLALGLVPGTLLAALARALAACPALATPEAGAWRALTLGPASGALAPLALLMLGAWTALAARAALGGTPAAECREVWTGGAPAATGAPPVHPLGFYSPLRESMRRAWPAPRLPRMGAWPHLPAAAAPDRWLVRPAVAMGRRVSDALRHAHTGVPHVYLAWQLAGAAALVLLMLALRAR
jgi:hydrogenase-4 component B